jgi:hypothetical protein
MHAVHFVGVNRRCRLFAAERVIERLSDRRGCRGLPQTKQDGGTSAASCFGRSWSSSRLGGLRATLGLLGGGSRPGGWRLIPDLLVLFKRLRTAAYLAVR